MWLLLLITVLYFYIFFFFKQKTAYEMRISDWSSDVCSSDLHGARDRPNWQAPRRRCHPRRWERDRAERMQSSRQDGAVPPRLPQIGRASCRERVCQYV